MKTTLKLALLASSALFATPVLAQTPPLPPEHHTLDARGVDLVTGRLNLPADVLTIGSGDGALSSGRFLVQGSWQDPSFRKLYLSATSATVVQGSISIRFTRSGSTFTPVSNNGQSLKAEGSGYVFTSANGEQTRYSNDTCYTLPGNSCVDEYNIASITKPNGETLTYAWTVQSYLKGVDGNGNPIIAYASRLASVVNNFGYRIAYGYVRDSISGGPGDLNTRLGEWRKNTSATAYNEALESSTYVPQKLKFTGDTLTSILVTNPNGGVTTYGYNAGQQLVSVRYPDSSTDDISITYEPVYGKVLSLTDATGAWTYSYTDVGTTRTTVATGPLGQSITAVSNLTIGRATSIKETVSTTPAVSRITTYTYDTQQRLKRVTLPEGDYAELTYDARGNVTQTLYAPKPGTALTNITTSAVYPATCANPVTCNLPTSTTDARENTTNYSYDPVHGGVVTVTAPAPTGSAARPETRIAYAAQTAWYRNASGVLVPAPSSVTLPVSASSCVTGSTCTGAANEVKTSIVYGASGVANNLLPTSVTTGAGNGSLSATTAMTYTPNGDVATVDGPLAGTADTTTYRYDNARQLIGVIGPDPDGTGPLLRRAQRYTYNPRGQVTLAEAGTVTGTSDANWAAFASLQQVATAYDNYGRLTHQRQQSGSTTHALVQTGYDAAGRVDCVTTRMNRSTFASPPVSACAAAAEGGQGPDRITKYGYDAASQLISTTSGFGTTDAITESAAYSLNGKPISLTDGRGNISTLTYDRFDRMVRMNYPNATGGGTSASDYEEYSYDPNGNVLTFRTRGAQTFTSTYDALNRRTAITGGGLPNRTLAYDNLGRTTSVAIPTQTTSFTYDALGRTTAETGPMGTMSYQYDLAGRRTRQTWPDAFYVTNSWNLADEMTAISHSGTTQIAGFAYDNLGRRTGITRGNGVSSTYTYDAAGRLGSLSHDLPGTANDVTFTYTYNAAGQILTRVVSNPAYAYAVSAGTTAYVNNGRNQVTTVGGVSVSYDASGNITNDTTKTFAYDGANRMTSGGASTMSYDALGRLYELTGANFGRYLYDGAEAAGFAPVGSNTLQNRFIRGPGTDEIIANYTGTGPTPAQYWLADERGSLVNLSEGGSGATTVINTYDDYGVPAPTNLGRFQYTGQMWMPDAGVYHYKARAYQPGIGRFLQTDPIGYAAGGNVYAYVGADPVNATDPWGLEEVFSVNEIVVTGSRIRRVRPAGGTAGRLPFLNERAYRVADVVVRASRKIREALPSCASAPISASEAEFSRNGNRLAFWESRASRGDPLAPMALSIVQNQWNGRIANNSLATAIFKRNALHGSPKSLSEVQREVHEIGVRLMQAHVVAVNNYENPSAGQIAIYHYSVFQDYGLDPSTFGGSFATGRTLEAELTSFYWRACAF